MSLFKKKPPAPTREEFAALAAERDRLAAENVELLNKIQDLNWSLAITDQKVVANAKASKAELEALQSTLADCQRQLQRATEKNQRLVAHLRKKFAPRPGRNQKREERALEAMLEELDVSREPKKPD